MNKYGLAARRIALGVFWLCLMTGNSLAETHVVTPTGDVSLDGDNIQAAIDAASPGDTIFLGSGTFVLGKYLEEDTAWVSTSRGSFQWYADYLYFEVRDPDINPYYWLDGGGPDTPPFPQAIVVDKPLLIEGADPLGSTTITVVNTWLDNPFSYSLYGDANSFVVASTDVTIRNIRFYNMPAGVSVISAGTTIENNIFDTPGHYSLRYIMDEYAAYPNLPSRKHSVRSYLRRNTWLNAIQAIHLFGSEVEVTDNYFEIRNSDPSEIPFSLWAIVFGGAPDYDDIDGIYTFSECRNNLLQDNMVIGDENSWYGAFYFAGYGPESTKNTILNNTVEDMFALVESHGRAPVRDNSIVGNEVIGGPLIFDPDSFGVFLTADYGVSPQGNIFSHNRFINVTLPMVIQDGESNVLHQNDYTEAGVQGWSLGYGGILLGENTHGNFVVEKKFPVGTYCDQILDLGVENKIPGFRRCK